jgi:hypothetical protein
MTGQPLVILWLLDRSASTLKHRITAHAWTDGPAAFWCFTLLSLLLAGWVVGTSHPNHKAAMVSAFI